MGLGPFPTWTSSDLFPGQYQTWLTFNMRPTLLVAAAAAARRAVSQEYGQEPIYESDAPKFTNWTMAIPNIARDFTMICDLNPSIPLGSGPGDTKYNWISFAGGEWNATWGQGTVEVGHAPLPPALFRQLTASGRRA